MLGWNFVFDLACTLLCGPMIASWAGGAYLVAPVNADCSCKVCECKDVCKCTKPQAAAPAPSRTAGCADMHYCPGQHGGRAMSCPPAYTPCVPPAVANTFTLTAPSASADTEKQFSVEVRLTGTTAGGKDAIACPRINLPANTYSLVSFRDDTTTRAMHVQVQPIDEQTVRLNLKLSVTGGKKNAPAQRLSCSRVVRLDTVTGLVLDGCDPEPCMAEVRVVAVPESEQKVAPPMKVSAPINWDGTPASPVTYTIPPTTAAMPAPLAMAATPALPPMMPEPIAAPTTVPAVLPHSPALPPVRLVSVSQPAAKAASVCLMKQEGKSRLMWKHADGSSASCVRMTRETGHSGALAFAAGKKFVHVEGEAWHATADKVEVHDDGFLVMTGHVKVVCKKGCARSTLTADRVAMKVKAGKIDKVLGGMNLPK